MQARKPEPFEMFVGLKNLVAPVAVRYARMPSKTA